jgi:hypothetical protein
MLRLAISNRPVVILAKTNRVFIEMAEKRLGLFWYIAASNTYTLCFASTRNGGF